jgi:hypothetical protein
MSFVDRITAVMNFSQKSMENTMDVVKEVHQAIIEIPIDILLELGYAEESAALLKQKHRRLLEATHGGIKKSCGEINQYIVKQATVVSELAEASAIRPKPKSKLVELEAQEGEQDMNVSAHH